MTPSNCGQSIKGRGISSIAVNVPRTEMALSLGNKMSLYKANPFLIGEGLVPTTVYKTGLYEFLFQRCAFLVFVFIFL